MNRLVQSLQDFCRGHLLEEKWLVAPSLRAGHQWVDALTRSGGPVLNIRCVTLRGMALDLAGPTLASRGLRLVSPRGSAVLADGILNRLKRQSPTYLTKLTLTASLAQSVAATINDLRLAGLTPDTLRPDSFTPAEKGVEMATILREYLEALSRMGLVDYAAALDLAAESFTETPNPRFGEAWRLIPEDLELNAKERELLRSFPQDRIVTLDVDRPDALPPVEASATGDLALLRWIREPFKASVKGSNDGSVSLFRAVGESNEIREVFRRCLAGGRPFDDVELLHTDSATYVPLIYEAAARVQPDFSDPADLFVTFEEGIPASYARPGRGLSAWVAWIRGGYLQSTLVTMLHEGLVEPPESALGRSIHERLARLLRSTAIGFGRGRYLPALKQKIRELEARPYRPGSAREDNDNFDEHWEDRREESVAAGRCLRQFVTALIDAAPRQKAPNAEVLQAALIFLDRTAVKADRLDNYAYHALRNQVADLQRYVSVQDGDLSLDVWDWLSLLPEQVRVMGSGPRPGCMHVSSIYSGGHSLRKHTVIVGLDDARFPGAGLQDPVILDRERRNLSDELPTATRRLGKKLRDFAGLLARLRGALTMSYPCRELVDDREIFPSQVILNAYRIISGNSEADFRDLDKALGTPVSFAPRDPEMALDTTEWWLSHTCPAGGVQDAEGILARHFPHLARGNEARTHRDSQEFTVYDGRILNAGADLDPASDSGPVLSASRLEAIGKCPLAYFFGYVLDLEPLEDVTVDPEQWLDAMQFGDLLHEVLHDFVVQVSGRGWPPAYPDDMNELLEMAVAKAVERRETNPAPSEEAFMRQVDRLLQAAEIFLRVEAGSKGITPMFLEAALGMPQSFSPGTALDTSTPLIFTLPGRKTIKVRGRLDRIDRIGDRGSSRYLVCDYKSGSASRYEAADPFNQGRVVQHALYLAMAEARLKQAISSEATVEAFTYFFPGRRDHGLSLEFRSGALSAWPAVVGALCDISASGNFLATNDAKDCPYCDYRQICRDPQRVIAASRRKLDNSINTLLKPMRDLRSRV